MKARIFLCLIFVVLLLPSWAAAKDAWTSVRSKNFFLVGDANEKDIRRVGTKLEQFREALRLIFPKTNFNSNTPTTVIVFKSEESFRPFKPVRADGTTRDKIAGYFQKGEDVNYIALSAEGESKETYQIIFHEYVHFLVDNNLGKASVPPWFNEGLAEYYSTFRIEDDQKAILGELQPNHLLFLQQQKLIPLEQFFGIDYFTLHNQGNHGTSVFYAQSWALLHYLQQGNKGAHRPQLSKFLSLLLNNKPPREAFQEAFQTDYAAMEKELKIYVAQNSFNYMILTLKDKLAFDAEMQTALLSEAESNAYLGDLLLHTNRLDEAAKQLQKTLAMDDKSAMAHASLGMTFVRQNKFAEAQKHLEKAVALNSKNYLPHFYYAYALSREGMDKRGFISEYAPDKASKMRESLMKAISLNPNFPESYRLYAFVNLVNNVDLDDAILALQKAISLEPGNQQYALDLAQIYMRQEKFDEATRLAESVFKSAADDITRGNAKILLGNISSFAEQLRRIKESKPRSGSGQQFIEYSQEELLNQSLNEALRKPRGDEKRVVGYLTNIDCEAKNVTFAVRVDNQTLKFSAADFQNIFMMAFTAEAAGRKIGCGARKPEDYVVLTFRPSDAKVKSSGEIIAVEFMPKTFKLNP